MDLSNAALDLAPHLPFTITRGRQWVTATIPVHLGNADQRGFAPTEPGEMNAYLDDNLLIDDVPRSGVRLDHRQLVPHHTPGLSLTPAR